MSAFLMQEMQAAGSEPAALAEMQKTEAGRAPSWRQLSFLRRSLLSSYALGFPFLLRGDLTKLTASIADLNRAFEKPPASSEQILHREVLGRGQGRRAGDRGASRSRQAAGPRWSLAGHGTLGELNLALLTEAPTPAATADALMAAAWTNEAAAGIGGDAYQHYSNGAKGETVLARWDTVKDAEPRRRCDR